MCGIVGCICRGSAEKAIRGLRLLEYRGYDSWGIAVKNSGLQIIKKKGKISEDEAKLPEGGIAIAHTRWATHGKATKRNAHPHLDCKKQTAIVHNGIIDNYLGIKSCLQDKGHKFLSETDSEAIAHLIEEELEEEVWESAFMNAVRMLEGSYAILAISANEDTMLAARNKSPLAIGIMKEGIYASSDALAFPAGIKEAVFLRDHEVAVIGNCIKVLSVGTGRQVVPEKREIQTPSIHSGKGDWPHFMLKEIFEQADVLSGIAKSSKEGIKAAAEIVKEAGQVILAACGTSYNAALASRHLLSKTAGIPAHAVLASEFSSFMKHMGKKAAVIAVSQSGETADVLEAVRIAEDNKAKVISVVNAPFSTLSRCSDRVIYLNAGPEMAVASTKAFTAQTAIITGIGYACAGKHETWKKEVMNAANAMKAMLSSGYMQMGNKLAWLAGKEHMFAIGRSMDYAIALEAALKIKEVSYIHAEGFAGGELKHGTLALIKKGTPCLVFACDEEARKDVISNTMEIKARGGKIIGVSTENAGVFDYYVPVPRAGVLTPLLGALPAQMLAYALSVKRGYNPDKPRNLAKSVTVK